jgi:dGTPase
VGAEGRNVTEPTVSSEFDRELERAVRVALDSGAQNLDEVLRYTEGADVRKVLAQITALGGVTSRPAATAEAVLRAASRRFASALPLDLPAADPLASQWWFTLDTVEMLSTRAHALCDGTPPVFLGAPTVSLFHRKRYSTGHLLDVDEDIIAFANATSDQSASKYDVNASVPTKLERATKAVIMDPPWYPLYMRTFFSRAVSLTAPGGIIVTSLPPRLTRPGVEHDLNALVRVLLDAGLQLVGFERLVCRYMVPEFEAAAFADVPGFSARPWRPGDLLTVRVPAGVSMDPDDVPPPYTVRSFARSRKELRVFVKAEVANPALPSPLELVGEFSNQVSTRAFRASEIGVWTSARRAARVRNPEHLVRALAAWAHGNAKDECAAALTLEGVPNGDALDTVECMDVVLGLWETPIPGSTDTPRRTPEQMAEKVKASVSLWAATASAREHLFSGDGFRLDFPRDRDRILWSHGLKALANKTQVFDLDDDDHVRQRLAHSVEVMQLASTIGASFGLDRDLIEAGALAHDIGHTPFGHAGEYALDALLNAIEVNLRGFNHYEHGVDVVRYLEDAYLAPATGSIPGLNITPEVSECIFKHTFCLSGHRIGQKELWQNSKHQDIFPANRPCHLEGQAVRIADKISYLISDLEDGVRMGVFTLEDLGRMRLFDRAPIDMRPEAGETALERFISQRRAILSVLMEDAIEETARRMQRAGSMLRVRASDSYTVFHSSPIERDVTEIWKSLQAGKLHKDRRVVAANMRASKIVGELVLLFTVSPELVDRRFARAHSLLKVTRYIKFYESFVTEEVSVPRALFSFIAPDRIIGRKLEASQSYRVRTSDLIQAKDYVASMTDHRAKRIHGELLG